MSDDIDKYNADVERYNAEVEQDAKTDKTARSAGTVGYWFGVGLSVLLSAFALTVIGLMLFAAVRGIGRWLEVW